MATKKAARTLDDYARAARKKACKLCGLPTKLQIQLANIDTKIAPVSVIMAWLREEHGIVITAQDYIRHGRGGHGWLVKPGKRVLSLRANKRTARR